MITDIESYFSKGCGRCPRFDTPDCSALIWSDGVSLLRDLCLKAGLTETVKWGHPCYVFAGRNIALIGAFRGDFRLTFMDAALLNDTAGRLEKPGPNSRQACLLRFHNVAELRAEKDMIHSYLVEAKGYAAAKIKPTELPRDMDLPEDMVAALDADPELAEAFAALTPGRQRSYIIALSSAKKPETRIARIAKFRAPILAGKGAMER